MRGLVFLICSVCMAATSPLGTIELYGQTLANFYLGCWIDPTTKHIFCQNMNGVVYDNSLPSGTPNVISLPSSRFSALSSQNSGTITTPTPTSVAGLPAPTGTVSFYDGSTLLGTTSLATGTATLSISTLSVGSYSISAVYSGDSNYLASTSNTVIQIVNPALTPTSSTLTVSPNPSVSGSPVTIMVQVSH